MIPFVLPLLLLWFQADAPAPARIQALAVQLATAKSDAERDALVAANRPLITPELDRALEAQGDSLKNRGSYSAALSAYAYLKKLAESINDGSGVAGGLRGGGAANFYLGNYDIATRSIEQALALRRQLNDQAGIGQALGALGAIHFTLANYQSALQYSLESMDLRSTLGDRHGVSEILNNLGLIYANLGEYDRALDAYRQSIAIKTELKDLDGTLSTYSNMANLYFDTGNYRLALEYYEHVLDGWRKSVEPDRDGIAKALHNIAGVHLAQRNPELALDYLQKSLKIHQELEDKAGLAESYIYLADAADQMGNHASALRYEFQALDIRKQLKLPAGIGICYDDIGTTYQAMGDLAKALEYYRAAVDQFHAVGNKAWESMALAHIASVTLARNDPRQALSIAAQALATAPDGYGDTVRVAHHTAGQAESALGHFDEAAAHFRQSIDSIEAVRDALAGGEEERARYFEDKVETYASMVGLQVDRGRLESALAFAERARGRVLLDILSSAHQPVTKSLTPAERDQERRLNVELASWNSQLARERERPRPDRLRIAAFEASRETVRHGIEAFQTRVDAIHPELAVQRGRLPSFDLDKAGALLATPRSAFLEYVVGEKRTLLFVLRRQDRLRLTAHVIPIGEEALRRRVAAFRRKIDARALDFRDDARQLYDAIIAPARADLTGVDNLTLMPDAGLWDLPFQALLDPSRRYLLEQVSISYAPSITVLGQMMQSARNAAPADYAGTLLALGNPRMSNQPAPRPATRGASPAPLPEAEREVRMLGQLYGPRESRVYTGPEARETRIKQEAGRFRIIHIATHGYLDNSSPMYSYVRLAEPREAGEDGFLEAREISNLDLRASLTVLSACETGRGRVGAGEGVIGLAWALFVAGSPSSVVSQWKVDSASTANLMLEFHKGYREKLRAPSSPLTTAGVLRQASLTLMRDAQYAHPFYWAGFVLLGDGR
ncbi:MAG: CHAT domain-containing protein [Acidobacteria bacterium]|nr:CHAT domain-containing protein [Acidobacteriota bacterium]